MSVKVVDESVSITSEPVIVESETVPATIEITDQATAIVSSQDYIVTTNAAAGYANGGMPDWLVKSIDIALENGLADQDKVIHDISVLIAGIEKGVQQSISSIENEVLSQNTKIDTVKSELDENAAAIVDVKNSYVTKDEAVTVDTVIQSAEFNENNATILSQSKTIAADEIAASYESTGLLATVTDPTTGVAANSSLVQSMYTLTGVDPTTGELIANSGYISNLTASIEDQIVSIDSADTITLDAAGDYTAVTSKMITDSSGAIAGWTTTQNSVDGQVRSDMSFIADKFTFSSATNPTLKPFTIDAVNSKINMTADVEINGGLLVDGIIQGAGNNFFNLNTGQIKMDDSANSFILDSAAAGTDAAPNIQGGYIKGSVIEGDQITANSIVTDQIVANSISTNSYDFISSAIALNTTYKTVVSATITIVADCTITASCFFDNSGYEAGAAYMVRILRGSTVIFETGRMIGYPLPFSTIIKDAYPGINTYYMQCYSDNTTATSSNNALTLNELKR